MTALFDMTDPLDRDVAAVLRDYEQLLAAKHGKAQVAGRARQGIARLGVQPYLAKTATQKRATTGLSELCKYGRPTFEHVIVKHAHRFTADEVAAAQAKVDQMPMGDALLPRRARRGRGSY